MAIIQDYYNGPCHIIVHDDSIQPPDEVERIIERVSKLVLDEEFRRHLKANQNMEDNTLSFS